ncbi:MAG: hypothetical protein MZU97_18230 [Bacillus subtilis]|nr:hypothetical protein [Bacillus subtilis]
MLEHLKNWALWALRLPLRQRRRRPSGRRLSNFENGVTAAFTMTAFTHENTRTIKLMGTKGEIRGHMDKQELEVHHVRIRCKSKCIRTDRSRFRTRRRRRRHHGGVRRAKVESDRTNPITAIWTARF